MCLIESFIGWRFRLIFLMKCVADAVFVFMNRPFFLHSVLKRMLVFHSKCFGKICLSSRTSKFNKWVSGMFQVVDFVESNGFFFCGKIKKREKKSWYFLCEMYIFQVKIVFSADNWFFFVWSNLFQPLNILASTKKYPDRLLFHRLGKVFSKNGLPMNADNICCFQRSAILDIKKPLSFSASTHSQKILHFHRHSGFFFNSSSTFYVKTSWKKPCVFVTFLKTHRFPLIHILRPIFMAHSNVLI